MDNITHGLAGILLAQAGFRQRYGPIATVTLAIAAELPDSDALFELGGPVMSFVHHRGMTHSLLGGFALALFGAALVYGYRRWRRSPHLSYWVLLSLMYLGVLLHIWMDYLTSYGTRIFLPFDTGRYTADAVFIIDFFYTGIIISALLLIRMVRRQQQIRYLWGSLLGSLVGLALWLEGWRLGQGPLLQLALQNFGAHLLLFAAFMMLLAWIARNWSASSIKTIGIGGSVALAVYMALCLTAQAKAQRLVEQALGEKRSVVRQVAVLPLPAGGLWQWHGIVETPEAYQLHRVSVWPASVTMMDMIAKQPPVPPVCTAETSPLLKVFQDFARFPVLESRANGDEEVVRYFDLRFSRGERTRSWFDLVLHCDLSGRLRVIEFLDHLFFPEHSH